MELTRYPGYLQIQVYSPLNKINTSPILRKAFKNTQFLFQRRNYYYQFFQLGLR